MNKLLYGAAFGVGLAVIGWIGAGYLQTQPLALGMTALIAAFYLMGALELRRFHQATSALDQALRDLSEPPAALGDWLQRLPASLRNAVRTRIEGERSALPGPALTPYLVGLLVLLGMLGTFLGMVVTLSGTSLALERATDLQTMRDSLAAPVKGLGLAFGTSVAGVATSAMLGPDVGAVPAPAAADAAAAGHAHRHHAVRLHARPPAPASLAAAAATGATAAAAGGAPASRDDSGWKRRRSSPTSACSPARSVSRARPKPPIAAWPRRSTSRCARAWPTARASSPAPSSRWWNAR